MKGRQAVRIAAGLAGALEAALAEAGCDPPPREDLVAYLWPFARAVARSQRELRRVEALHRRALASAAGAEAACADAVTGAVASWVRANPPSPVTGTRVVDFDPGQWIVALQPGSSPAGARATEAA